MQKSYELFTEHQFDVAEMQNTQKYAIKEVESILKLPEKSLRKHSFLKRL